MPLTFRKSIPIVPGILFLNVNRRSWSISVRLGPLHRTWSTTGRDTTSFDLPGPLGYRTTRRRRNQRED